MYTYMYMYMYMHTYMYMYMYMQLDIASFSFSRTWCDDGQHRLLPPTLIAAHRRLLILLCDLHGLRRETAFQCDIQPYKDLVGTNSDVYNNQ